jgi:hypothetical protein
VLADGGHVDAPAVADDAEFGAAQAMLGQEPPMYFRSTTAARLPVEAKCQAVNLPDSPQPREMMS